MRGVGPVPVMSPMSKSFRKRERSSGASRNVKNSSSSTATGASPSKKPKLAVTDCSGDPSLEKQQQQEQEQQRQQHERTTTSSPALSGASSLSTSNHPKVGAASVSSPSTPDRPGQWSLRPRQSSGGIVKRTRRLYYDVHLTEDDATKLLGHRIKMWWPLDKRWYLGEIKNYDSELRQHWIVYDDGDKEWVKLEEENFRLQLLPGDSFERAAKPRSSTYCLNSEKDEEDVDITADVCSRLVEQPSSRATSAASEDNSSAQNVVPGPKPVSVYARRRHSRNGSRGSGSVPVTSAASTVETDTIEVQSPIRVCEPSNTALSYEDQEGLSVTFGEAEPELGIIAKDVEQEVRMVEGGNTGYNREMDSQSLVKWPLSRNVAELLRFIEIRSRSRKGTLVGGRLLNQVWRGMLPVWNMGNLFDIKLGPSTELLASGEMTPTVMMESPKTGPGGSGSSLCMLISWNGFTLEKNARLKEVLETSLRRIQSEQRKQIFWKNTISGFKAPRRDFSVHTGSGSYLSVTLLSVPSNGRQLLMDPVTQTTHSAELVSDRQLCTNFFKSLPCSAPATELVFTALVDGRHSGSTTPGEVRETRLNTKANCAQTARVTPYAARSSTGDKARMLFSKNLRKFSHLRKIFHSKWKDLSGPGLRLSINESLGLFSSRHLPILLRIHRLNTQAVLLLRASSCQAGTSGSPETRPGLQELLSMSKKGRRTIKGIKRISQEEGLPLPPPKRIRIAVPEPAPVPATPTVEEQPSQDDGRARGNILKLRRCPTKRGAMWCVATSTESVYDDLGESPSSGTCTANLLIVQSDRGWRETGATIEQQADGDTSILVVSLNGEVLYTYKAYQPIQAGISNKHTHALMWRGGKDWMLEFTDKMQWSCFRSMHAASCVTNARALSMKHIPIPGVREVPDDPDLSVSFLRPWGGYIKQPSGEIDAALSTSRVLYDMDSEDEEWLDAQADEITDEVFEKTIHYLERAAYIQKQEISLPVAVELCSSLAPAEAITLIHAHWLERRRKHGMALIRCFQAPACDRYEAALQAWRDSSKQTNQPPVFAFCMRPNGSHKMSRQRSQRRISHVDHQYLDDAQGLRNVIIEPFDSEFYSGSPGSDAFDDGSYGTPSQRLGSRSKGRKPGKRPRRMKSISGGSGSEERRGVRTFIAPATAMNLMDEADQFDGGDSCSSMDFDLNDDALVKAQLARKAARIAASKAARAQELYAVADAAMKRAVACLIEAEALAAAEKAGRDNAYAKLDQQQQHGMGAAEEIEDDDDLLLPISNWTQEFGSGLIQKGGGGGSGGGSGGGGGGGGEATVASPRKSLRYINQSSLFKGMVS
ncbi:hypothetical protein SELMODRAFT_444069 [Selaginella moellendorffii]|uniref:Enhancer of polycomb-like protein n=1 Tax=Selaginella moellendorffii TaxID=88036 RepID=D8S693_SELML|nr:uncharacterized protein LOC9659569 [Selaginella moellendorffii]EFJ19902.1 hypothetical protein SELMODRAFT_444069 [Selaginella moellendorffii]|eukprot:XP_002978945.1 uncharacterized protein LOC9659569 [Selaginella moellendorffii]